MGENGQSFSRDSKVPWDQTVGSKIPLIFGSLSTGSPVDLVGLINLLGLMYSQATVTAVIVYDLCICIIMPVQCLCDQVD